MVVGALGSWGLRPRLYAVAAPRLIAQALRFRGSGFAERADILRSILIFILL